MQALVKLSPSTSAAYLACSQARDSLRVRRPAASTGRAASSFSVKQRMPLSGRARRQQATSHRVKQSDSIQACPLQQQHPLSTSDVNDRDCAFLGSGSNHFSSSARAPAAAAERTRSPATCRQRTVSAAVPPRHQQQHPAAHQRPSTRQPHTAATETASPAMRRQQRSFVQLLHIASSGIRQHTCAPRRIGSNSSSSHPSDSSSPEAMQGARLHQTEQPRHKQIILSVRDAVAARARMKGRYTGFEGAGLSRTEASAQRVRDVWRGRRLGRKAGGATVATSRPRWRMDAGREVR
jgi:hypothetical protein